MDFKKILNLITIGVIVLLPHAGLFPFFTYAIPILLLTYFALRKSNESFANIGFRWKQCTLKAVLVGGGVALLIVAFMQLVFHPLLESLIPLEYHDSGLTETLQESKVQFLIMVIMGWLIGGFYEEIVFHGFIFTRLEQLIQGRYATPIGFAITALLFGGYHIQLGALGVVNALVVGAVYLGLFVYFKRNLWYAIICHGVYNTTVMTLLYLGYL